MRGGRIAGLAVDGTLLVGRGQFRNRFPVIVATNKAALGQKLNKFCTTTLSDVLNKPGTELIDVVIGDPHLLRQVKMIAVGKLDDIEMPDKIRRFLSHSMFPGKEYVVFENKDGSRVYVNINFTTLLKNTKHLIDKKFLAEA